MMKSVIPGARALLLQVLATSFMTGLIWFVQVVHYPLMEGWPHDEFGRWEVAHRDRTGPVVIPPMLIEGVCCCLATCASAAGCSSTFPYRWHDGSFGHLGKHIFSSSALSSAAFNRLGCSNSPFSRQFKLDTDYPLVIQNGPFCGYVVAVLVGI